MGYFVFYTMGMLTVFHYRAERQREGIHHGGIENTELEAGEFEFNTGARSTVAQRR
jgi:hypothetical protein